MKRKTILRRRVGGTAALLTLESITSVTALLGGTLLVLAPDGTLLATDPTVLAGTPFEDWRIPGVLLALLVGGGFAMAAISLWSGMRGARQLSQAAGFGLVLFELVELAWIGFHPLQVVFGVVGMAILVLASRPSQPQQSDPDRPACPTRPANQRS